MNALFNDVLGIVSGVIPAQAGIHLSVIKDVDPRLHGDDTKTGSSRSVIPAKAGIHLQ